MTLTKRVATLGPSTDSLPPSEFEKLLDLVDGVRVNPAHAALDEVKTRINAVRTYEKSRNKPLPSLWISKAQAWGRKTPSPST